MDNQSILTNKKLSTTTNKQQYPIIDLFKYLGSLLIVAIHIAPFLSYFDAFPLAKILNYGIKNYFARIAVPFYFAAAGFFLFRKIDLNKFDISITGNYILKILRLLGIWTVLLFIGKSYQLWYLGSLAVAVCFLTILLYKRVSLKNMLIIACVLYLIGLLGDSYYGVLNIMQGIKPIHYIVKIYEEVFKTTRNGIFFGFIFVLLGGIVQKKKISIKPFAAACGFIISMVLLLCEALLLKKYELVKDFNMYIMLIPATFFLLVFSINFKTEQGQVLRKLRNIGIMVYFLHLFVYQILLWVWSAINKFFGVNLNNSIINYILTVVIATIIGVLIDYLSKTKKFSFLKYLYS